MTLTEKQKNNLSQLLLNISSAWFIGGIVTPIVTSDALSADFLFKSFFAMMSTVGFYFLSIYFN